MGDREGEETRYRAFLSYSHKDAAAAGRLHRRLEAWRIPRRLVGRETNRGPVPRRLWPIFRDREELPAATDLSETVREALAQSGALIILCSPDAAGSLWVAEEIRVFRELHPARPILAAILDGDPPDCFPPLLRAMGEGHEPLATDLRSHRDGERLGLLKLVAGITGLGLDDLVQRDASRRVRRVMAVTAGAVVAMLAMAVLVVVAISARREAEHQRAEAEGQIEFMLTDLRAKLRTVGRLDIMETVNQRALDHYRLQQLTDLDPAALERRARILQAMGEDDLARGQFAVARTAFEDAYRTTAEQLARNPNDPARIYAHAQSEYWVGEVHRRLRDWRGASAYFRRYAQAAERLVQLEPANPDFLMEAGYGASNMGTVQLNGERDPAAAQASFTRALQWFRRAEQARPGDRTALRKQANAYANIADTFYARRQWRDALAARQRQYAIYLPLHEASPNDMEVLYDLATAERAVGRHF
jgi:tetratricopeptide (TPR) repeat protein